MPRTFGFGFNDNAVGQGIVSATTDAVWAQRAGATVERMMVDWRWVESTKGTLDFSRYDQIYAALRAAGIRPLWGVLDAPHWAWDPSVICDQFTQDCRYPPTASHFADAARFAAVLAARYPDAAGIEIWNEPNLSEFWAPRPDPAAYVQLLRMSYQAVKAANPAMPVVMGGVSDAETTSASTTSLSDWLFALYEMGARDYSDAVNVHPYPGGPALTAFDSAMRETAYARHYFGDDRRPIWVTETGLSTFGVTSDQQRDGLLSMYRSLASRPDVTMVIFHTLFSPPASSPIADGYGILAPNLTPRPALCAFAAARQTGYSC